MIYLDNAATTRPDLSAVKAAAQFNESLYYNPSALYREGLSVRKELNAAREFICRSLSSKHDLVFTSCGSEADNQAIFGTAKRGAAITTAGEHAAVYKSFAELKNRGIDVSFAPLKKDGSADVDSLLRLVADKKPGLVSVVHVNNETGAINDIGRIGILADGEFAGRNDAFALEPDVEQNFVMLELHDSALDQIAFVEVGQGAIDHLVHLVVGDVLEVDDGRVLDFGQNGPLSSTGTLRHGG